MITGRTALYGVLGHPVAHSRSPRMQNAAFAEAGLDAVYVALAVPPDRLADAVRGAHALGGKAPQRCKCLPASDFLSYDQLFAPGGHNTGTPGRTRLARSYRL